MQSDKTSANPKKARLIAFYLPQFHPVPENDEWWGKGFTEWTNVTRAKPNFRGHHQPLLPSDLGFYDLRLPEVREAQADLARTHGIEGFCYWHYWFHGRRILERPFAEVLQSGKPDFPFCLGWANESWSRSWLGDNRQVILEQKYSHEDDITHARWLAEAFADRRYLRVKGRPLLLVYRPKNLPDPKRTTDTIRSEITRLGLPEPFLAGSDAHSFGLDMREFGFDLTQHHEPQLGVLPGALSDSATETISHILRGNRAWRRTKVYRYADARRWMDAIRPKFPHFSGYFVGWDNTARRGSKAIIIEGNEPAIVANGLRSLVASIRDKSFDERLIFINAWNEWAEGNYLEPDQKNGYKFLEAFRDVICAE
jgi:lipopolysaccharide biosynthesis protein